ncbi:MAG TPA: serpin family protein, partial [Gemmataceae bacterium]
ADFYDGAMHVVDFPAQPDEAVRTINTWVSDKTREKIKELINRNLIDKDTCLILTNAIYFKGQWEARFQQSATGPEGLARPARDLAGAHDAPEGRLLVLRGQGLAGP